MCIYMCIDTSKNSKNQIVVLHNSFYYCVAVDFNFVKKKKKSTSFTRVIEEQHL